MFTRRFFDGFPQHRVFRILKLLLENSFAGWTYALNSSYADHKFSLYSCFRISSAVAYHIIERVNEQIKNSKEKTLPSHEIEENGMMLRVYQID